MIEIRDEQDWLRYRRGESVAALAKERGVTRERMRVILRRQDRLHPAMIRIAALEEAAQCAEAFPARGHGNLATSPDAAAEQAAKEIASAIRNLKVTNG